MADLKEIALLVYEAIFGDRRSVVIEGREYLVDRTLRSELRVVEIGKIAFLEQNPEKDSRWGEFARQGHKILWVIDDGHYVAQVIDGEYHNLR
jgi:hypothetical protein